MKQMLQTNWWLDTVILITFTINRNEIFFLIEKAAGPSYHKIMVLQTKYAYGYTSEAKFTLFHELSTIFFKSVKWIIEFAYKAHIHYSFAIYIKR